jgi:hypothetical protein
MRCQFCSLIIFERSASKSTTSNLGLVESFVLLNTIGNLCPILRRAEINAPEIMGLGIYPCWIIERTGIDELQVRRPFRDETNVCPTGRTECQFKPPTGAVRNVPVSAEGRARDNHLFHLEYRLHRKR